KFEVIVAEALEENPEMTFEDIVPVLEENFGFVIDLEATEEVLTQAEASEAEAEETDLMAVSALDLEELRYAFEQSKLEYDDRNAGQADVIKGYYSYLPISIASTIFVASQACFVFIIIDHSSVYYPFSTIIS